MHAIVVGAGMMGTAITHAMQVLGFDVSIVEPNEEKAHIAETRFNVPSFRTIRDITTAKIVISAATYTANEDVASYCLEHRFPYCDLGGHPDVSASIQKMARIQWEHKETPVFTDLGLAPGLVNIIAEDMVKETARYHKSVKKDSGYVNEPKSHTAKEVIMRVGGLPAGSPWRMGRLKYGRSWSTEGLRNEYSGDCEVLRDGKTVVVQALSEVDSLDFPSIGRMESFHTKGGLSYSLDLMANRGVERCEYKTIRFPGHANLVDFLLNECKLDEASFDKAIAEACPKIQEDQVLITVDVDRKRLAFKILHDKDWTAMQKATAFPAAAVASMVATGLMRGKPVLDYSDIPTEGMQENLNRLGMPQFFGMKDKYINLN